MKSESFISNPKNLKFLKNITEDSYAYSWLNNTFCLFKSINNIICLIFTNERKSIISYNLVSNKKINEIKNAHVINITNFRYYLDKINKRDLIISISSYDNNIKLWDINNIECLINIQNINENGFIFSACFLYSDNNIYIITSNGNYQPIYDLIKVFDLNGNKIKEINGSNEHTIFIDNYYDNKMSKNFIIACNSGYIKSYDYNNNILYHKYHVENDNNIHFNMFIYNNKEEVKLIDSSGDGNIIIWDFHSGLLNYKIKVCDDCLNGICLWDNKYLFVGCNDKTIKLIEFKKGEIVKDLIGHEDIVLTIKKILHPEYGECLITQGYNDDQIKLWINKY